MVPFWLQEQRLIYVTSEEVRRPLEIRMARVFSMGPSRQETELLGSKSPAAELLTESSGVVSLEGTCTQPSPIALT